tara:strand:- start:3915 stop:4748 length:834 start_codon:yes stop_codon:yes gene_type:complete
MNIKYTLVYLHMNNGNKQLLLEVVDEQYKHYNIKQNAGFMGFYNNIYKFYQRNQGEYDNIQQVNKKIIQESIGFIRKNITRYANNDGTPQYYDNQQTQDTISLKQIDATDLRYVKDDKFDMKLKKREDEFTGLMNAGKPKDIDFTFKSEDDLPAADLNKLLGQTLADREKELENITNKYNKGGLEDAAKWLKINEEKKEKGREKLKEDKKVTFKVEEKTDPAVNSLLSKLKPIQKEDDEIKKLLNTILDKQNEILDLLKEKKIKEIENKVEKKVDEK